MTAAKEGDTVRVHYSGTLKCGTEFDSARDSSALEFTIGQGQIIPGFETAVIGMNPGEIKTFEIPSTEAYGPHRAELSQEVERRLLPPDIDVQPGTQLLASGPNQQPLVVTVDGVMPERVILDANHPHTGEDLTFII